jgi:xylose isomerase
MMLKSTSYFADIAPVKFAGPDSADPLSYRYYDSGRVVLGKTMAEQLRLSVCYWHTFCWNGFDVFGAGTFNRPWHAGPLDHAAATMKLDAAFDFVAKLGIPYFCFHDVDVMAEARTAEAHVRNLSIIGEQIARKMDDTGIRLLWGTANLFSHPRYMAGAATNPDPDVFAYAAMQVRHALELTHRLGGANYVLWGGREGYDCLLNTRMGQELDQLGRFLSMVVEHKHKIGFKGTILIEPKPHEPTKHQYDTDVATVYGFLRRYGLENEVRVNIEANHATLAGHSFEHEIALASDLGIFGSLDMNRGDPQNGWDTDQFPNDLRELTTALYYIIRAGGFTTGGINFDAKVRRQSIDPEDLFHGHVGAIDLVARALLCAETLIKSGEIEGFLATRYQGWEAPIGKRILAGELSLAQLSEHALQGKLAPAPRSGKQEWLENLVSAAVR